MVRTPSISCGADRSPPGRSSKNYRKTPIDQRNIGLKSDTLLAVAHYLDAKVAGGDLFPEHCLGLQEIVIAHIEDTLEGLGFRLSDPTYVDAIEDLGERVMVIRHKERKMGSGCVERWRAEAPQLKVAFEAALASYEGRLGHSQFLFGKDPVYADYALYGVLGNAQFGGAYTLGENLVHLKRWESQLANFSAA